MHSGNVPTITGVATPGADKVADRSGALVGTSKPYTTTVRRRMAQNCRRGSARRGRIVHFAAVHGPRKCLQSCVEEVGLGSRPPCSAPTSSPSPSSRTPATARDRRWLCRRRRWTLETALAALRPGRRIRQRPDARPRGARHEPPARPGLRLGRAGGYPGLLSSIADPPIGLWVRGRLAQRPSRRRGHRLARGLVRRALEIAHGLGAALARARRGVVSGLARGCDGARTRAPSTGRRDRRRPRMRRWTQIYPAEHGPLADADRGAGRRHLRVSARHAAAAASLPAAKPDHLRSRVARSSSSKRARGAGR